MALAEEISEGIRAPPDYEYILYTAQRQSQTHLRTTLYSTVSVPWAAG